jgi:hypothetical protein
MGASRKKMQRTESSKAGDTLVQSPYDPSKWIRAWDLLESLIANLKHHSFDQATIFSEATRTLADISSSLRHLQRCSLRPDEWTSPKSIDVRSSMRRCGGPSKMCFTMLSGEDQKWSLRNIDKEIESGSDE